MLPYQSNIFLQTRPEQAEKSVKSEFDILALEMQAMLDRIETCWQNTPEISAIAGVLAGLSADVAASVQISTPTSSLVPLIEELRTDIGHVFAGMQSH